MADRHLIAACIRLMDQTWGQTDPFFDVWFGFHRQSIYPELTGQRSVDILKTLMKR